MEPMRDLPMGFGILLLENPQASLAFEAMSPSRQQEVLRRTHAVSSREEMRSLVNSLAADPKIM